jgi:hypothetical protein
VKKKIENQYGDKFIIGSMSVQGVIMNSDDPDDKFLEKIPQLIPKQAYLKRQHDEVGQIT